MKYIPWNKLTKQNCIGLRPEYDPLSDFPFLELCDTGVFPKEDYVTTINSVRGITSIQPERVSSLTGKLRRGWFFSAPGLPHIKDINDKRSLLDRRNTLAASMQLSRINYLPGSEYERVRFEGTASKGYRDAWMDKLSDESIFDLAGVRFNAENPDAMNVVETNFTHVCIRIRDKEEKINFNNSMYEDMLFHMGIQNRYTNSDMMINKILNKIKKHIEDAKSYASKNTMRTSDKEIKKYIQESNYFSENHCNDEKNYRAFSVYTDHAENNACKLIRIGLDCYLNNKEMRVALSSRAHKAFQIIQDRKNLVEQVHIFWDNVSKVHNDNISNQFKAIFPDSTFKCPKVELSDILKNVYWIPQIEEEDKDIKIDFSKKSA
jgi:hypothetical protein